MKTATAQEIAILKIVVSGAAALVKQARPGKEFLAEMLDRVVKARQTDGSGPWDREYDDLESTIRSELARFA